MKFFNLLIDEGKKKKYAEGLSLIDEVFEKIQCFSCGTTRNIAVNKPENLKLILSNNNYPDFLGYKHHKLARENVIEIFHKERISGVSTKQVDVFSLRDIPDEKKREFLELGDNIDEFGTFPPRYYELIVTGKADLHPKTMISFRHCNSCGYTRFFTPGLTFLDPNQPKYISNETWDGSDMFVVPHFPVVFYCSNKFVDIYKKYNLTGILFKEIQGI